MKSSRKTPPPYFGIEVKKEQNRSSQIQQTRFFSRIKITPWIAEASTKIGAVTKPIPKTGIVDPSQSKPFTKTRFSSLSSASWTIFVIGGHL
ncbi:MAG: hypothetical protein AAGI90_00730 [Chlamydiota bacterium]